MSRKKKKPFPGFATTDYFAELRKAHPDRRIECEGCQSSEAPHAFWCSQRHGEEP